MSRPLFLEEHGLRLLLEEEGVGVELDRRAYENGDWAGAVLDAWERGREGKRAKRATCAAGRKEREREREMSELARCVRGWVDGRRGRKTGFVTGCCVS